MKRILLALAVLSASTLAQNAQQPTPPPYCKPCLFYGGDFDPSNPASSGLTDENTVEQQATVYVAFYVPRGQAWTVAGVFADFLSSVQYVIPSEDVNWSISSGLSSGNQGTTIASGTLRVSWTATGRSWMGYTEYTALGRFAPQTVPNLTGGIYWMSV